MPDDLQQKQDKRLAFLADRMALLMVDIVRRDFDYGKFCHDEFYTDEIAGYLRQGKEYQVCLDFVRMMIKSHDKKQNTLDRSAGVPDESGVAQAGDGVSIPPDS